MRCSSRPTLPLTAPSPLVRSQSPCYSSYASYEGLSLKRIPPLSDLATSNLLHRCTIIRDQLSQAGLFPPLPGQASASETAETTTTWRLAVTPFPLTKDQLDFFHQLGPQLLSFYRALNRLYIDSVRGLQPAWVAGYLDQGKPEGLLSYSRMKRFRDQLPAVIRPDIIPTQDGMVITELDSVPGGIGITACLSALYADRETVMVTHSWEAPKGWFGDLRPC